MQPLPDNRQRAKNATLMMMLTMILYTVSSLVSLFQILTGHIIMADYAVDQIIQGFLGLAQFVIEILTIVFFIMWFRRAYNNLFICGVQGLPYSEGWAAGGWFVPIISLFYPYRIMNAIWTYTQSAIRKPGEHYEPRNDGNIGWWWAFWLTGSIVANIQIQLTLRGDMYDFDPTILGMDLISNVACLVSAFIGWKMIQKTSEMETDLQMRYQDWAAWHTQQQGQAYQQQQNFPQQ